MDKTFIAHRDYIDNTANISCVLLRSVLEQAVPKRLDSIVRIDSIDDIDALDPSVFEDPNAIPLGDLNFVRRFLSHVPHAVDPELTPIEIPDAMMPFVNRKYFWSLGADIDKEHKDANKWFVKDIDVLKRWNSNVYDWDVSEYISPDTMYSISEKVNFLSEWRIFVYEDVERGAYNYLGDPMIFPDSDVIHDMISSWRSDPLDVRPRAYTLDVGVYYDSDTETRVTEPIEIHPFAACGLYGFSEPVIVDMLIAGYEWYRDDAH